MTKHFGYTNHNPGNLRYAAGTAWQGLADNPRYVPKWDKSGVGFYRFKAAKWGIRACARTLIYYQDRLGDRTLRQVFNRYAPFGDHGNNPNSYASAMARSIGTTVDAPVDLHTYKVMRPLLEAIFKLETGQEPPYDDATYDAGILLAGIALPADKAPVAAPKLKNDDAAGFWLVGLLKELFD